MTSPKHSALPSDDLKDLTAACTRIGCPMFTAGTCQTCGMSVPKGYGEQQNCAVNDCQKRLLAARIEALEADRDHWHKIAMDAGAVTCTDGSHIFPLRDRIEALEAQLAEARKALEAVRFNLFRAGYEPGSIMIEGIDKTLAALPKDPSTGAVG